jgi:hypothetical protein
LCFESGINIRGYLFKDPGISKSSPWIETYLILTSDSLLISESSTDSKPLETISLSLLLPLEGIYKPEQNNEIFTDLPYFSFVLRWWLSDEAGESRDDGDKSATRSLHVGSFNEAEVIQWYNELKF